MSDVKAKLQMALVDFGKSNGADFSTFIDGPSLTRQEFKEECDINTLMAKYDTHVIGGPGNLPPPVPLYADFGRLPQTLLEYMSFMQDAESAFMSLPAVVRKEFENDPTMFVEFASDPSNLEQMRTWGLAPPAKPQEEPQAAPVVSTAPAPGPQGTGLPVPPAATSTQSST